MAAWIIMQAVNLAKIESGLMPKPAEERAEA
jgi:hypothetical protein